MSQSTSTETCAVAMRHGQQARLRQATLDDVSLLSHLLLNLSEQTRYLRYLHPLLFSSAQARIEADRMIRHSSQQGITVIATVEHDGKAEAIAVAELVRDSTTNDSGECAVLVRDDFQRHGLGSALSQYVMTFAHVLGVTRVHVDFLPENRAVLRLMRLAQRPYMITRTDGLIHAVLDLQVANDSCFTTLSGRTQC